MPFCRIPLRFLTCTYLVAAVLAYVGCATAASGKETFSIDYIVTIPRQQTDVALVRWELAGIEEINHLRLRFHAGQLEGLSASGKLETTPDGVRWIPGGPYAHLTYRVPVNHTRGTQERYDSYATSTWIVTRARRLFPRIAIDWSPRNAGRPKSRARLIFRLPRGWRSATAWPAAGPDTYGLSQPGKVLDRPRGWFALGRFDLDRKEVAGIMLQLAHVPPSSLQSSELFRSLEATLPALKKLLKAEPETVLLVSAPDPMWRGGISGAQSLFMHADRPFRTPDKTSPYLHELFHVLQPYTLAPDADWIGEGLAEYYSLELQRRAGLIGASAYRRGLGYFQRFGLWNVDLRGQRDNAATNNSAPLVMHALNQRIQHVTAGKKRLDDVVLQLATRGGKIDTNRFRRTVGAVTDRSFTKFFERHVARGVPPSMENPP